MSHTPGPWFVADWMEDDGPNLTTIEARRPEILGPGESSIWPNGIVKIMVAETVEGANPLEDARLISAAPELLEACKAALGAFEHNHAINWDDLARAIAKAEGSATILESLSGGNSQEKP